MKYIEKKIGEISEPKQWPTIPQSDFEERGYIVYGANGKIGYYNTYNHEEETIVITCRGATCGQVNITEPFAYVTGNAMSLDKLDSDVDKMYLYYLLKNRGFTDVITGSAQPQIIRQNLTEIKIKLPIDKNYQVKISTLINSAELLLKKRLYSLKLADEFLRSTFLEMFGDPVSNNKNFPVVCIRDIVQEVKYGTSSPAQENGRYKYLRMNNLTYNGFMDFTDIKFIDIDDDERSKYMVTKGDLLFNRTNSKELVGKTAVFNEDEDMVIAGYLIRVRTNPRANTYFLSAYLNSSYGKSLLKNKCKSIIGMANINAQEFQDIKIYLPPIELQNKYSEIVEKINGMKRKYWASKEIMENQFNSLMQKAFRGEL